MHSPSLRCQARRPQSKKVRLAVILPGGLDVEHESRYLRADAPPNPRWVCPNEIRVFGNLGTVLFMDIFFTSVGFGFWRFVVRFMYLFMVVLQVCIFCPKTHFGSRGYSFGLL